MKKCIVPHCDDLSKNIVRTFFILPRSKYDLLRWCENLQIEVPKEHSKRILVCSEHFKPQECTSKKVKSGTVPTLKLGYKPKNFSKINMVASRRCCFGHCRNTAKSCTLFSFPTETKLRNVWCQIADVADKKDLYACEVHFPPEMVGGKRLAYGASPTEYLKPLNIVQSNSEKDSDIIEFEFNDCHLEEEPSTNDLTAIRNEQFYQNKIAELEKKLTALEEEFQQYKAKCSCQCQQTIVNK